MTDEAREAARSSMLDDEGYFVAVPRDVVFDRAFDAGVAEGIRMALANLSEAERYLETH